MKLPRTRYTLFDKITERLVPDPRLKLAENIAKLQAELDIWTTVKIPGSKAVPTEVVETVARLTGRVAALKVRLEQLNRKYGK